MKQVVPDSLTDTTMKEEVLEPKTEMLHAQRESAHTPATASSSTQRITRPVKPPSLDALLKSGKDVSFFVMKSVEVGEKWMYI